MIKHINSQINSIKYVAKNINEEILNKLAMDCESTLKKNNSIIVSGLGKNVPICDKFVGTMLSLGMRANFLNTNSAVHGDLGMIHDGDLVIVLTKSGETIESIYLTEQLKKRNIIIWLISFKEKSTLSKMVENSLILDLEHEGDKWNLVPNNSSIAYLLILQSLAMKLSEIFNVGLETFKMNHPGGNIGVLLESK